MKKTPGFVPGVYFARKNGIAVQVFTPWLEKLLPAGYRFIRVTNLLRIVAFVVYRH